MQWFLACLVVRVFPRVFAGAAEQHSYLDGLLLHRALPPPRGPHRTTHMVARSAHRIACRGFSLLLFSSGKRQKDAQEGCSITIAWKSRSGKSLPCRFHAIPDGLRQPGSNASGLADCSR
jgi:hypothetical protein